MISYSSVSVSATGRVQMAGIVSLTSAQWNDVAGTTSGLVPGTLYYLASAAGLLTATKTDANTVPVGVALDENRMQLALTQQADAASALAQAVSAALSLSASRFQR